MHFTYKKPSHILALILLIGAFILIIGMPLLTVFNLLPSTSEATTMIEDIQGPFQALFDVIMLLMSIVLFIIVFILIPFAWYALVNKANLKEILYRIQLKKESLDKAFLWGFLTFIIMFALMAAISVVLVVLGIDAAEAGNLTDIDQLLSIPSMFILIAIQPIGEEIFFRGFLFDKISNILPKSTPEHNQQFLDGKLLVILSTAVLFGLAHFSYGKIYPVAASILFGIILGVVYVKTKNLYTTIIAHVLFNVTVFVLYLLSLQVP